MFADTPNRQFNDLCIVYGCGKSSLINSLKIQCAELITKETNYSLSVRTSFIMNIVSNCAFKGI